MKADTLQERPHDSSTVKLDGHSYPVDPMSEEFTGFIAHCFLEAKKTALARKAKAHGKTPAKKKSLTKAATSKKNEFVKIYQFSQKSPAKSGASRAALPKRKKRLKIQASSKSL